MSGSEIQIKANDGGTFSAYVARPKAAKAPGVVVIQEIFGVNKNIREIADGLAEQGYIAIAPDLFWRQEPGIQLTDQSEAEWKRAFELYQGFDVDKGVDDIAATIKALRADAGHDGKVGAVGYCLGGFLAYLTAARTDADASVGYYGVAIETKLDEAKSIKGKLMLHVAAKDQFVPPPAQDAVKKGLGGNPNVTIHVYEGQDHAFARPGGQHYDKTSADLANQRTRDFFKANLG
jgi:carboxymethylenebutenolidase